MHTATTSNWKLGAIVAFFLAALVFAIFYLSSNKNLLTSTITLSGLFPDVSGVVPGNSVRVAGIEVGNVEEIEFVNDSSVRVYAVIRKEYQRYIKKGAKMAIGSDGLLGDKTLNILKGNPDSSIIEDGAVLATVRPFDSGKMLASLKRTAANARVISKEFSKISHQLNGTSGAIGRFLNDPSFAAHLSNSVQHLSQISAGPSEEEAKPKSHFSLKGIFKKKKHKEEATEGEQKDSTQR